MTEEEIKEILDILDYYKNIETEPIYCEELITTGELQKVLDYIVDLQQENEKLKYNARGQVNDYFKDKYADEVLKSAELKKENETLKAKLEIGKTCGFCPYYNYKSRFEKANEKLNKLDFDNFVYGKTALKYIKKNLQNILNGSDENE